MKTLLLATALLCLTSPAFAADVKVSDAYAYETSEGMKNGAALFTIKNDGKEADRLLSASSTVSAKTQIHEMTEKNGIMKMGEVPGVDVKAGDTVTFSSNGYHVMLIDLKAPLKAGSEFPLSLKFEKAGTVETKVSVKSRSSDQMDMSH